MAVDVDDRDIDEGMIIAAGDGAVTNGCRGQGWCLSVQVDQKSGGRGIQLAYVSEGQRPWERLQDRRHIDPVE